jgi:hypothetical protein
MHRLYHDVIPFPDLSIEDGTDNIFIPTGFDTKDLISIATGISDINIQNIEIEKPITYEEDNQRKTSATIGSCHCCTQNSLWLNASIQH